jgi:hypothetical protein
MPSVKKLSFQIRQSRHADHSQNSKIFELFEGITSLHHAPGRNSSEYLHHRYSPTFLSDLISPLSATVAAVIDFFCFVNVLEQTLVDCAVDFFLDDPQSVIFVAFSNSPLIPCLFS